MMDVDGHLFRATIFNRIFLKTKLTYGQVIRVTGRFYKNLNNFTINDLVLCDDIVRDIIPVYKIKEIADNKYLEILDKVFHKYGRKLEETLPIEYINRHGLLDFKSSVKLVSKEKVNNIIGISDYVEKRDLYLGKSPIYDGVDIGVNINQFFANHFAIFGNSGSGKSYSMVFLAQKVRRKFEGSPTFVILTDREELNSQISDTFENCGLLGKTKASQFIATSGDDLVQKLKGNPFLKLCRQL